jgi:hypothetical protein
MIRLESIITMLITNNGQGGLASILYLINLGLRWR